MVMDSLDGCSPLERLIQQNGGKKMNLLDKLLGKKPIVGDSTVVSTLIQSIAVGADPKTQVAKIRTLVAGDETFSGYLDELALAGDESKDVLSKACEIVDNYYKEHLAGDEDKDKKPEPEPEPEPKPTGDEDKDKKPEPEPEDKKDEGKDKDKKPESAGDSIDYDLIAQKTAAILMAANKVAGDENPAIKGTVVIGGDTQSADSGLTSDKIMEVF